MRDATEFAMRASRVWLNAWFAGANAMTTIALRLPVVTADPSGAEAKRMVREKVVAASQGALAASLKLTSAAVGRKSRGGSLAAANMALGILEAATAPGFKRVRANARRLSKRKRVL